MTEEVDISKYRDDPDDPTSVTSVLRYLNEQHEAGLLRAVAVAAVGRSIDGTPISFTITSYTENFLEMTGLITQMQHSRLND